MAEDSPAPRRKKLRPPPDRYNKFLSGELTVSDLDDEEIQRGQLRNSKGHFGGRPPQSIPREFMIAMQMEHQRRMNVFWATTVELAQNTILEILKNPRPGPGEMARLRAAEMVMERNQGKSVDRVEIKATISKFDEVAGDIIMDVENLPPTKSLPSPAEDIVDAWIEEDDDAE